MGTGTRRILSVVAMFTTSAIILLSGAATANANGDVPAPAPPAAGTVKTDGPVITVTVTGSGYQGGSPGSVGGGSVSVSVPAPCWMIAFMTGKEYYEYVTSGQQAADNYHYGENQSPGRGYELYKDDILGHWYGGMCSSANWPDQNDMDGFFAYVDEFFATHPIEYVPDTQTPPVPPVPPVLLREVAIKNLTLPDPKLDWNPKRIGNQGTLVNLDTWFWLDNAPTTLSVQAAAGGNAASVTATFNGMDISAPGEAPLSCTGPGTRYTPTAHTTTCALAFSRASSALGAEATPVTVKTTWTATWAANGVNQGPITPQPAPVTATTNILVDEVQTLVTSVR